MTTTPHLPTRCRQLKEKTKELLSFESAQQAYDAFLESGDKTHLQQVVNAIDSAHQLLQEFQTDAINLVERWYDREGGSQSIPLKDYLIAESSGRLILDNRDNVIAPIARTLVYFPALIRKITGNITLKNNQHLQHLDYLEEVDGNFNAQSLRELTSMHRLRKINGDVYFRRLAVDNFPSIEFITGNLELVFFENVQFPHLKKVGNDVLCFTAKGLSFPELEEVGGTLSVGENNKYMRLKKVGGILRLERSPFSKIRQFRRALPILQEIGNIGGASIRLPDTNMGITPTQIEGLKDGLLRLRDRGKLRFTGKIL